MFCFMMIVLSYIILFHNLTVSFNKILHESKTRFILAYKILHDKTHKITHDNVNKIKQDQVGKIMPVYVSNPPMILDTRS